MAETIDLTEGDLTEIDRRVCKAHDMVSDLCHGRRDWVMSIPARRDIDPDLVIGDSLRDIKPLLNMARRTVAAEKREADQADMLDQQGSLINQLLRELSTLKQLDYFAVARIKPMSKLEEDTLVSMLKEVRKSVTEDKSISWPAPPAGYQPSTCICTRGFADFGGMEAIPGVIKIDPNCPVHGEN